MYKDIQQNLTNKGRLSFQSLHEYIDVSIGTGNEMNQHCIDLVLISCRNDVNQIHVFRVFVDAQLVKK